MTPNPGLDARYPIALLPVRLETRFSGSNIKVRIFPDEIFADTHEPSLTADEARDGNAYVAAMNTADEAAQWGALVARYGAPRAAWIALASAKGSPAARADSWTRAAHALLPDKWIVRAYQSGRTYTATVPIPHQPMALTLSPNPGAQVTVSDALTVDAEIEWTIHYDAAVAAGMAVTIDLTKPDLPPPPAPHPTPAPPTGVVVNVGPSHPVITAPVTTVVTGPSSPLTTVDTSVGISPTGPLPPISVASVDIIVVGVKDQTPEEGAAYLHALLDAQHYTRGLAFLAPGTPTNNTSVERSAFPPDDPRGAQSFKVERRGPLAAPQDGSDGDRFARALGLIPNSDEKIAVVEHVDGAGLAQDAAASAMNGALWPATLGYFMQQMMAPQFDAETIEKARQYFIGAVRPGGPLPAFRIGAVPYGLLPVVSLTRYLPDTPLSRALRVLRDSHFLPAASNMPRVTAESTDPDGDLLKALAVDASCREVRIRLMLGQDVTRNTAGLFGQLSTLELQQALRAAAASSLLSGFGLSGDARLAHIDPAATADLLHAPLVTSAPLSETTGVTYIQTLIDWASASPIDFASIRDDKLPGTDRPLLYRILRHALLLEMDRASQRLDVATFPSGPILTAAAPAPLDVGEIELVNLGSVATITAYDRITSKLTMVGFHGQVGPYLAYLKTLAALPSAELERRFTETLDACAYRIEAWITSLATERLWSLRDAAPTGCHVGAFGWVENVRSAPSGSASSIGGFIHAPSAAHASTAAILRNGYLSRGGSGSPYAVDLSSSRVRAALDLLDGSRQGEPLSALLGYRFERDLHEYRLERLIAPLRAQFPTVAGRTPEGVGPVELVAASTVVDGLALRAARPQPPGLTPTEIQNFQKALQSLDEAVDGLADVLTAESVFQAVRGNPTAAVAGLDAMAQGVLPPEVDVVRTPLGGTTFTHRLAIVLDGGATAPGSATPRASAEPALDAWAAMLLGGWSKVGCRVTDADGTIKNVRLNALKIRPLDFLALAKTSPSGLGDGELDRRVLAAAGAAPGATIQYDAADAPHSFAEWLELARAVNALVAGARAMVPADLLAPVDAPTAPISTATAQQAAKRAQDAIAKLAAATSRLTTALAPIAGALTNPAAEPVTDSALSALRAALQSAALFGITGAYPDAAAGAADLAAAATGTLTELAARQSRAPSLSASDPQALLAAATATMTAVFGKDFVFLPQFMPSSPDTLTAAITETATLVGDPHLPRQLLQRVARVRAGVGRWRSMFLYCDALGTSSPSLEVAQLPRQQSTWAAAKGASPVDGTVSLLLHRPTKTPPTGAWAGLIVDEWNDMIPSALQSTSLAFRHEMPVAEAPQAVLLAVPPTTAAVWDQETLIDTVRETLSLAKVRVVDSIDELRPFLPAICLTGNTANETVSTDFLTAVVADPVILGHT